MIKAILWNCLFFFFVLAAHAQEQQSVKNFRLTDKQRTAPEEIFVKFRDAGMQPVDHPLVISEKLLVEKAFGQLPALHQKILREHLHSISFMDNMPNTALTSPVELPGVKTKMFNITFRAAILRETISQWATTKEQTCFVGSEGYEIVVDAGNLDAFLYVLLHEATHVVDAVLDITPHPDDGDAVVQPTAFTHNIWEKMNLPSVAFIDPLLETTRFRGGGPIASGRATEVYGALGQTPFVSLYSMASWFEDLAEITAIYHLTQQLNQPYRILVLKDKQEVFRFEPTENGLVRQRFAQLAVFYD